MHMIRHERKRRKPVMPNPNTLKERLNHYLGNRSLSQINRPAPSQIQIPVHPNKSLPGRSLPRRCKPSARQAPMQVPGQKDNQQPSG